jgi:hemolysin III
MRIVSAEAAAGRGSGVASGATSDSAGQPFWRGWLHTLAFVLVIPGGVLLLRAASGPVAIVSVAIYGAGLALCFGTSAGYHRLTRAGRARRVMQRADHAMIYVLIACTYTPVCLIALPLQWGIPLLSTVWAGTLVGAALKIWALGRYRLLEYALYPALGWCVLTIAPVLVDHLRTPELLLMLAGGVLYTVGVPVLALRRPDPWPQRFGYHEVWHTFTVVAALCHFGAVTLML